MTFNIDLGTFSTAVIGLCLAWRQLGGLRKQVEIAVDNQKSNSLQIVLEIETQMNQRKLEFDKAAREVREAELSNPSREEIEILDDYFNATKENYFNVLDRLCFCIDKEYIKEKDWRTEYRNAIKNTIEKYEDDFNEASPYRNIKKINYKWQNE